MIRLSITAISINRYSSPRQQKELGLGYLDTTKKRKKAYAPLSQKVNQRERETPPAQVLPIWEFKAHGRGHTASHYTKNTVYRRYTCKY